MKMKNMYDTYILNNKVEIPCIGFGTYKAAEGDNEQILSTAIEAGYLYFDTASFYDTERFLAKAIEKSGLDRKEFFITSKAWKTQMGYQETKKAFQESLDTLHTDYLDLYLIHWPRRDLEEQDWKQLDLDTWRALEELYKEGKVRAIGVSNFLPHHLENLLEHGGIKPAVDQIEYHPGYLQKEAVEYCQKNDILVQAWSPLGKTRVLQDPLLVSLAEKYGVSTAQICLRFELQEGILPLPKSSSMSRMKQNQDVFSFELSEEDMEKVREMPETGWSGEHPDRERVML